MGKRQLNLYIDDELIELAKSSDKIESISQEFNDWLKFRLQADVETEQKIDYDLEIAKHKQKISSLEAKKELVKTKEELKQEENEFIDHTLNNILDFHANEDLKEAIRKRVNGFKYLYKNKYKRTLSDEIAIRKMLDRAKERGLI